MSFLEFIGSARRRAPQKPVRMRPLASSSRTQIDGENDIDWQDASSEDASSEDAASPLKPGKQTYQKRTINFPTVDITAAMEGKMARYLPYMPALFDKDLPPCGAELQVAYENVNKQLRNRWLHSRGQMATSDVCQAVKDDLTNQSLHCPAFSQPFGKSVGFRKRHPWRRETVFNYELCWINYFVRESQALEPMTESEIVDRAKDPRVPAELDLSCNNEDVLRLWEEWHKKKRAISPLLPDVNPESGPEASTHDVVEKDADDEFKDSDID